MEIIKKGKKILIDDEDARLVNVGGYLFIDKDLNVILALRKNGKQKQHVLARLITNCPKGLTVDHINHNRLDNRKQNLRICTLRENLWNKPLCKKHKTGFKGVQKQSENSWATKFRHTYVGSYKTREQAAMVYNILARFVYGEFAYLNPV